jgi:hypothetical protein
MKEKADQATKRGDYSPAIEIYESILARPELQGNEKIEAIFFNAGFCEFKLENFEKALTRFRQAFQKNPEYAKAFFYAGQCNEKLADYISAVEMYRRAEASDSSLKGMVSKHLSDIARILEKDKSEKNVFERLEGLLKKLPNETEVEVDALLGYLYEHDFEGIGASQTVISEIVRLVDRSLELILSSKSKKKIIFDIFLQIISRKIKTIGKGDLEISINKVLIRLILDGQFEKSQVSFLIKLLSTSDPTFGLELDFIAEASTELFETYISNRRIEGELSEGNFRSLVCLLENRTRSGDIHLLPDKYDTFFRTLILSNSRNSEEIIATFFSQKSLIDKPYLFYLSIFLWLIESIASEFKGESPAARVLEGLFTQEGIHVEFSSDLTPELHSRYYCLMIQVGTVLLENPKVYDLLADKTQVLMENLSRIAKIAETYPETKSMAKKVELLASYRTTGKISMSGATYASYREILISPNSSFAEKIGLLNLLATNAEFITNAIESGLLIEALSKHEITDPLYRLMFLQLVILICLNTKEEKLRELKEKYCVDDQDAQNFEKLTQMMKSTEGKYIDNSFLEKHRFYESLQGKCKLGQIVDGYLEKKDPETVSISVDLLRLILKILKSEKFNASYFYKPTIISLISYKIKNASIKDGSLKEEIFLPLAARMLAGLEVSQIAYKDFDFFVDALSEGVKHPEYEMCVFESLFGLTRILGEKPELWKRIWEQNKVKIYLAEHLWSENAMIRTAAVELLANCIGGGEPNIEAFENEPEEVTLPIVKRLAGLVLELASNGQFSDVRESSTFAGDFYSLKLVLQLVLFIKQASKKFRGFIEKELDFKLVKALIGLKVRKEDLRAELIELLDAESAK